MKKLLVATKNQGKVEEIKKLLEHLMIEVVSLLDLKDQEEVSETEFTFAGNAIIKAKHAYQKYGIPVLADDSGLCIRYLGNFPGVLSARFLEKWDYPRKNQLLIEMLEGVPDRSASYQCVLAYVDEKGLQLFEGVCEGEIAKEIKGENGFGYDPIFYYPPKQKTMAELSPEVKNAISHRGIALRKWVASLE